VIAAVVARGETVRSFARSATGHSVREDAVDTFAGDMLDA
jgi:hypothetical protein